MNRQEQLERMRREIAEQDAAWAHAKQVLAVFGDQVLAVPTQALVDLDEGCAVRASGTVDFNAVRA